METPHMSVFDGLLWYLLSHLKEIGVILGIYFFVYAIIVLSGRYLKEPSSHWHKVFTPIPFSSVQFYTELEKILKNKSMPGSKFYKITHHEGGLLSAKRLYLRIQFRNYLIEVCASPFGTEDFFISWWLSDTSITLLDFLKAMPIIGRLFHKRQKTFYEYDTEIVFREAVASSIQKTIEQLIQVQGTRYEIDWSINNKFKGL